VTLVNSGLVCWDIVRLQEALPKLRNQNAKREYYLTDCASILRQAGQRIGVVTAADADDTYGVTTRVDLAGAEALDRKRTLRHWMLEGVTIVDPESTYIDETAQLSPDC